MGTENSSSLVHILTLDFNKAGLSYGSPMLADTKQDSMVILPYLQKEQQSDPTGVSSLAQVGPSTDWLSFSSATKLTSGWASEVDD